jgi:hypothetical protein
MLRAAAPLLALMLACTAETSQPVEPASCPTPDASADAARPLLDAELPPAVCASDVGGADGGVVAQCDAPTAFSWTDVKGLAWDCKAQPCPRGARCYVIARQDWPGVCR